jgi:hypothetical protein
MLRVTLVGQKSGREISARALLDSGAEGIIIDYAFAKKNKLTLQDLVRPIPVRNIDGTMNQQGVVHHTTIQTIHVESLANKYHQERSKLYVTALGDHNLILGTDWLKAHNPEVDWATPHLAFTHCLPSCTLSCYPLVLQPQQRTSSITVINSLEPRKEDEPLDEEFIDQETLS